MDFSLTFTTKGQWVVGRGTASHPCLTQGLLSHVSFGQRQTMLKRKSCYLCNDHYEITSVPGIENDMICHVYFGSLCGSEPNPKWQHFKKGHHLANVT
jgi:hypothetical protein